MMSTAHGPRLLPMISLSASAASVQPMRLQGCAPRRSACENSTSFPRKSGHLYLLMPSRSSRHWMMLRQVVHLMMLGQADA